VAVVRILAAAVGFGILWGVAQGLWLVAPELVDEHRIVPRTPAQWLTLQAVVTAMCAVVAAMLAVVTAFGTVLWAGARRGSVRRPDWLFALAPACLVPLGYVALAAGIEGAFFGREIPARSLALAGLCAGTCLVTRAAYERIATPGTRRSPTRLAAALAVLALAGAAVLPWRAAGGSTRSVVPESPLVPRPHAAPAPLLFVGLDSGNWETLRPMLAQGRLPTLARLIAEGVHGTVDTPWPPYWSGPAWAAIVTGHAREETGVFNDLTIDAPGLPPFDAPLGKRWYLNPFLYLEWKLLRASVASVRHPPRAVLGRAPVWEMLHRAGVETAVVRFDFTEPPAGQGTVVVSSRLGEDVWRLAGVDVDEASAIAAPPELAPALLSIFSRATPADEGPYRRIAPGDAAPPGEHGRLEMEMLRTGVDIDRRTFAAARLIAAERPRLGFLAVYIGGFDGVCHAFWPYRFPEAYGADAPPADLVATFADVIDRYLEFLDAELARLLAALPAGTSVMIVADHGHTASTENPLWRGWHGPDGTFIAGGPAFPRREAPIRISYFDVVPTILDVLGYEPRADVRGVSARGG
jgi:hypothetical protein